MGIFINPSEGAEEIYTNFSPALKNLYTITISGGNPTAYPLKFSEDIENIVKYHASSIQFNGESINLDRDDFTKKFKLKEGNSFQRADKLTIKWRENSNWAVKRFHENWLDLFYNKSGDYYVSSLGEGFASEKYRNFCINLPYQENTKESPCIWFYNVLPQDTGSFDFAWSSSPSTVEYNISYYVEYWKWGKSKDELILGE